MHPLPFSHSRMQNELPLEVQLRALSTDGVHGIARRALANDGAELLEWNFHKIDVNTGEVTGGLYRVTGTALVSGHSQQWSPVLKVVAAPGPETPPRFSDVAHPLYWRREVLASQSGLLDELPGGLEAPCCLRIDGQEDGSYWPWLEDMRDDYGEQWSLEQFAFAFAPHVDFGGEAPSASAKSFILRTILWVPSYVMDRVESS